MELWNVTVELSVRAARHEEVADVVLGALAEFSPAVSRSLGGRVEVVVSVPADGVRQAVAVGLSVVESAIVGAWRPVVAVEACSTVDYDRRAVDGPVPDLLSVSEAAGVLGVSRQRVLQLVESGGLASTRVGNAVILLRADVERRAAAQQEG